MGRLSRRDFVVGVGAAGTGLLAGCGRLPWPGPAPTAKVPRVGYLSPGAPGSGPDYSEAFRQGLRERGYVAGQNVIVEYRWAEGRVERLPALAADLVRLPVDVLVAAASPAIWAAKQATDTIPVVMTTVAGPVEQGLVVSLARPGGNLTGVSTLSPKLAAKRVELLKHAVPDLSRVAVLWPPDNRGMVLNFQGTVEGAEALR